MYDNLAIVASRKKIKGESKLGQLFLSHYQAWYTEAHEIIRQILPARLNEFEMLYGGDEKRKNVNGTTYTIRDPNPPSSSIK